MTEDFMAIKFTKNELKRIIFPVNPVICRSCHKPRINKKLSVENFSQQHQAKICTVGKYHGKYNQNNEQNIVPNNVQNNGQNNPQNIAPNNAQLEIHHVEDVNVAHNIVPNFQQGANANIQNNQLNAQNFVTREEFTEFKNEFTEFKNEFAGFKNEFAGFKNEFAGFKESINVRFDRLERSIQALGGRNLNNEERKRKKEKKKKMR